MSFRLGLVAAAADKLQDFRKAVIIVSRMTQGTTEHTMSFRIRSVTRYTLASVIRQQSFSSIISLPRLLQMTTTFGKVTHVRD